MLNIVKWSALLLIIILAMFATACTDLAGEPEVVATLRPRPTAQPVTFEMPENIDLALGGQIFAERCTACHGIGGAGDGEMVAQLPVRPVNFTDPQVASGKTPQDWFQMIYFGKQESLMPAFGVPSQISPTAPLNEAQIWDVTMYLFTLSQPSDGWVQELPSAEVTDEVALIDPVTTPDLDATPDIVPTTVAQASPTGIVMGRVINGSTDSDVPADLPIRLYQSTAMGDGVVAEGTLSADGTFQFEDINMSHGQEFYATVAYAGGFFVSDIVTPRSTENILDLTITIYDTTYDLQAIRVTNILTYANVRNDELDIVQIVEFINLSDKLYVQVVDDEISTLVIGLPEGAVFSDLTGGRFRVSEDGRTVTDSRPVFPQSAGDDVHRLHFAFTMPYDGDVTLEQTFPYMVQGDFDILLQQQGISVDGEGFQSRGSRMIAEGIFSAYGASLSQMPQTPIRYRVTGTAIATIDVTDPATGTPNLPLAIGLVGAGVLSIAVAGWIYLKDKRTPSVPADVQDKINALVKEIADLDIQHKAGEIDDATYTKQRDKLKAQLAQLIKSQKEK